MPLCRGGINFLICFRNFMESYPKLIKFPFLYLEIKPYN